MSNNVSSEHLHLSNGTNTQTRTLTMTETQTLQSINKEKISFAIFYHYLSKFEIQISELESLLYWTSIAEVFFFTLGVVIYLAYPATLDSLWVFIVHLFRAVIGFGFLYIFPRTYQAIEMVHIPSQISISELEIQMKTLYKSFFSRKRSNIRAIFVVYVILTIISNSVNDYALFAIFRILCVGKFKLKNFLTIGFVMVYYFCNGVYFSWFSTLRATMPILSKYLIKIVIGEVKTLFGLLRRCKNANKYTNENLKPLDNVSFEHTSNMTPRKVDVD